jgi:acyl dehydratase
MKKTELNSFEDIVNIIDGFSYTSTSKKVKYFYTFLFGLITGDMNPIHINPITSRKYNSKFGGLARHGVSTLAQAESYIFNIFIFVKPVEIIAIGYRNVSYKKPVLIGDNIKYVYTLLEKKLLANKYTECTWLIQCLNQNNEETMTANWVVRYYPVIAK